MVSFMIILTLVFSLPVFAQSMTSAGDASLSADVQADGDSSMLIFSSAYIAAVPRTYWGASSYACCTTNVTTFYLTHNAITKKASNATCGPNDTTFEGWAFLKPQESQFSWVYESCSGRFHGNFSYMLEDHKQYLFFVDWVNGGPQLYVTISDALSSSSMQTAAFNKDNRQLVDTEIYPMVASGSSAYSSSADQSEF